MIGFNQIPSFGFGKIAEMLKPGFMPQPAQMPTTGMPQQMMQPAGVQQPQIAQATPQQAPQQMPMPYMGHGRAMDYRMQPFGQLISGYMGQSPFRGYGSAFSDHINRSLLTNPDFHRFQ